MKYKREENERLVGREIHEGVQEKVREVVYSTYLSKMILIGYPGGASMIHSQLRASL